MDKKLKPIGLENVEENRRLYRQVCSLISKRFVVSWYIFVISLLDFLPRLQNAFPTVKSFSFCSRPVMK